MVILESGIISMGILTGTGYTNAIQVVPYKNHTMQFKIASLSGTVVVRAEGTLEGNDYFNLNINEFSCNDPDTTITENGTYAFSKKNTPLEKIRFGFISEEGGTNTTIEVKYYGTE